MPLVTDENQKAGEMMRTCIRCSCEMVENLEIGINYIGYGICVSERGPFKPKLSKIRCAVCPKCGYLESYAEDVSLIAELAERKEQE